MKTLNIRIDPYYPFLKEAKYVFGVYGSYLGIKCEFPQGGENAHIYYGDNWVEGAVNIPPDDWGNWLQSTPSLQWLDGIPTLRIKGTDDRLYSAGNSGIKLNFDIIAAGFYLLALQEEVADKRRDIWGCFSGYYTVLKEKGILEFPVINSYAYLLKELLDRAFPGQFNYEAPCKDGKEFSVCLIHDVDQPFKGDASSAFNLLRSGRLRLKGLKQATKLIYRDIINKALDRKDPYFNFEEYICLERNHDFKSIFNFAALDKPRNILYDPTYSVYNPKISGIIRWIISQGWEIGLHASYESFLDGKLLSQEKARLEQIAGRRIRGVSQHYLRTDFRNTPVIQAKSGLEYDTSLGYNEALGFRSGAAFPFFPYDHASQEKGSILIFPLVIMDSVLFNELKLSAQEATALSIEILEKVRRYNGCASILWHLRVWDENDFGGWLEVYRNILDYLSSENAWVTSPGEVAQFWLDREKRIDGR